MRKLSILLISILSICNLHAQQFTVSSNETVNKFFKELYVVSTNEEYPIEELYVNTISRNKLASDGVRHYWGINFIRKGGTKPLYFLSYDNPESADVLEFDLTEDGKSAKMYAVVDWTAIEDESQFGTGRNIPLKYWDDLKFSPYISAYIDSNTGSDNGDEPIKFIDSNNYSTVFKELYIDSFSSKIYHKEEGKNIDTYLEDIPLDKVDLQINRIQRKILSSSSGNYVWGVVFRIKLPVYETRDGKNYIVRDENGEVQYTRNADFFFSMYEEENGVIDKNISLSSVLMGDNGEYFYFTYKMKLYAVIDWSQIEEGTSAVFNPKNILDAAYEINNSPQIKEYIEEKESYLPIKVDAKATLNLTSSNRIMLYGASMCSNSYPWFKEWLEKYTGAEVFNAGNPGWSAKRVASTTYYDKVAQINPDVIYIMLGGNDKGDDVGTFGAISTQTLVEEIPLTESWSDAEANDKDYKFIQSLDYILRKLKSEYYDINDNPKDDKRFPYIVVGTFTPQHREGYSMIEYNDPQNWLNKRNAAVECANKNNIPCLDVFSEIGIDWDKEPYYNQDLDYVNGKPTLVNRGIYTLDGLHLNEYGFERLARLVSGVFVPSNSGLKTIVWSESFNLDDYKTQGIYYITGERLLSEYDNLPIMNASPGHTISGQLTVLDASLSDAEQCITQYLKLTNRTGSEGKEYVRTYNKDSNGTENWSAWKELKQTANLNQISDAELKNYTENGLYEGAIVNGSYDIQDINTTIASFISALKSNEGARELPSGTLFTMEVLNNYAVVQKAEQMGLRISQSIVQRAKVLLIGDSYYEVYRKYFNVDDNGPRSYWSNWLIVGKL